MALLAVAGTSQHAQGARQVASSAAAGENPRTEVMPAGVVLASSPQLAFESAAVDLAVMLYSCSDFSCKLITCLATATSAVAELQHFGEPQLVAHAAQLSVPLAICVLPP